MSLDSQVFESVDTRLSLLDHLRHAERRAAVSRVASIIGHLIGTPLNVIAGRAALIRAAPGTDGVSEHARRIEEQVERLAQRIRRLIDYLTVPEPESESRSVEAVVAQALALYAPIAAGRGVELSASADVPDAEVDGASASVVLTSLLSLATRIAPAGERVRLGVERVEGQVRFELTVPGLKRPHVRIEQLDPPEGQGDISADQLQILSVCHAIARRLNGNVEITEVDSERSAIRFWCPILA